MLELVDCLGPEVKGRKKLTARWVMQKRRTAVFMFGHLEFKFLGPNRDGLFIVATAHVMGRLIDFYAIENKFSGLVGDACNAYSHTPQSREVCFPAPADMESRAGGNALFASILLEFGFERCPQQPQLYIHRAMKVLAEIHQDYAHASRLGQSLDGLMRREEAHTRMKWSDIFKEGAHYSMLDRYRAVESDSRLVVSADISMRWISRRGLAWNMEIHHELQSRRAGRRATRSSRSRSRIA